MLENGVGNGVGFLKSHDVGEKNMLEMGKVMILLEYVGIYCWKLQKGTVHGDTCGGKPW